MKSGPMFSETKSEAVFSEGASEWSGLQAMETPHPDSWYDSLIDSDICAWLDSQT